MQYIYSAELVLDNVRSSVDGCIISDFDLDAFTALQVLVPQLLDCCVYFGHRTAANENIETVIVVAEELAGYFKSYACVGARDEHDFLI